MNKRRRRSTEPDTRLDWRDPNMPVLRAMTTGMEEMSPENESQYSQMVMRESVEPTFKKDPSYNWAKKAKREFSDKVEKAMNQTAAKYDPITLAIGHQNAIRAQVERMKAEASCITRLLVGKTVIVGKDTFIVVDVQLGLAGTIMLRGKKTGSKRVCNIGTVCAVKIAEPVA